MTIHRLFPGFWRKYGLADYGETPYFSEDGGGSGDGRCGFTYAGDGHGTGVHYDYARNGVILREVDQ